MSRWRVIGALASTITALGRGVIAGNAIAPTVELTGVTISGIESDGGVWFGEVGRCRFSRKKNRVLVDDFNLVVQPQVGSRIRFSGKHGVIGTDTSRLEGVRLHGRVEVQTEDGWTIGSDEMMLDRRHRSVRAQRGIYLSNGNIRGHADRLRADLHDRKVELTGSVKMIVSNAPEILSNSAASNQRIDLHLQATRLVYDIDEQQMRLVDRVTMQRGDLRMAAPQAVLSVDQEPARIRSVKSRGGVRVDVGQDWMTSERLTFVSASNALRLDGHAMIRMGESTLQGETLVYDIAERTGRIQNATGEILGKELDPYVRQNLRR